MNQYFLLGNISAKIYFMSVASCLGLVFAWLNRDGSDLSIVYLLIIWQAQTIGPISFVILTHIFLLRFKVIRKTNRWGQLLISGLLGSLIFVPLGLALDIFVVGEGVPLDLMNELLDELAGLAPPVVFVWLAMNAPWILGYRISYIENQSGSDHSVNLTHAKIAVTNTEAADSDKVGDKKKISYQKPETELFYLLLPRNIGRDIVYLEAELHYLKVVTDLGEALILFNIKDAANLFHGPEAFLCHRSYVVFKKHIISFEKIGRGGELKLSNGDVISVSKRKLSSFREWASGETWLN